MNAKVKINNMCSIFKSLNESFFDVHGNIADYLNSPDDICVVHNIAHMSQTTFNTRYDNKNTCT